MPSRRPGRRQIPNGWDETLPGGPNLRHIDACDDCGFRYATLDREEVPGRLRALGPAWAARLDVPGEGRLASLRSHTRPGVWSGLEYACHVRDVLEAQHQRLALALFEDRPELVSMGSAERVGRDRYNEQAPAEVAAALARRADELAAAFAALTPDQWGRTGFYSWPVRAERDMAWLARHTVHEGEHHLRDLDDALAAAR